MKENVVKEVVGEFPVVTWMKRRIKRNQNCVSITQGPTGSGKSYVNIQLCLEVDSEFDVEKQVVFSLGQLMRLINSDWFKKKKWKQVIFEEAQISMSNRAWQSAVNKMLNYVLSTFRHQNIILYFNAPYQDFLDSQAMKLVHIIFNTRGIDRRRKEVKITSFIQQYNSKKKITFDHSIYMITLEGKMRQLGFSYIPKPPKEVCDKYEVMKTNFTSKLNKEVMLEAEKLEQPMVEDIEEPINMLHGDALMLYNYIKENPNKIQLEYSKELNIPQPTISGLIKKIEKKGINIRKYIGKPNYLQNLPNKVTKSQKNPLT